MCGLQPVEVQSPWAQADTNGHLDIPAAEHLIGVGGCSLQEANWGVRRRVITGCTIPMPWTVHIEGGQKDGMAKALAPSASVGSSLSTTAKVGSGVEGLVLVRKNRTAGLAVAVVLDSAKQTKGSTIRLDVPAVEAKEEEPLTSGSFSFAHLEQESPMAESAFTNGPSFQICAGSPFQQDWRVEDAAVRGASQHDGPMEHGRWPSVCSVCTDCSCPLCNASRSLGLGAHSELRLSQTEFQDCAHAEDFLDQFALEAPVQGTGTLVETQLSVGSVDLKRDGTAKMKRCCVDFGAHCFPNLSATSWLS